MGKNGFKKCSVRGCSKEVYKGSHGYYNGDLCSAHRSAKRRKEVGNVDTHKYEKTIEGFLMRAYRNMKSRITGVQKEKHYLYAGKELLSKEEFYDWARKSSDFLKLYKEWVNFEFNQKLTPSVNRINPNIGYIIPNMEWITNSQNSALSSVTKKMKNIEKLTVYNLLGVKNGEK
jgi:hypothetical protein